MKKIILCLLLTFLLSGCLEPKKAVVVKRYHTPSVKYSYQEWQDLGIEVWKEYYSPKVWEKVSKNSERTSVYAFRSDLRINDLLRRSGKSLASIDKTKLEIWARPLREMIVPIHKWFWFDSKGRLFFVKFDVLYNGYILGTIKMDLPGTE